MPTTTQTVIIDFQADFTSVENGIDTLVSMGKVDKDLADQFKRTNVEIKKQGDTISATANKSQSSTQSFGKLADLMKQFPKSGLNRFLLQMGNELAAAGVSAKDFYNKLDPKDAVSKQESLRQQLRQVREQMQAVALSGGKLSQQYQLLKEKAGKLDDTIKDVGKDIANAGSDTRGIDNVIGSIGALAGGYSAVQGAIALFGDENENLQKALLKVNAAMALATGIQQISNALQKEGSLTRLADAAATGVQIAVQKIYTFVTGEATAATVAFKVALAATGIGLVVVGAIALANAFSGASDKTKTLTKDMEALAAANAGVVRSLGRAQDEAVALAEKQGKKQSEIDQINIDFLNEEIKKNRELETQQRLLVNSTAKGGKVKKEALDAVNKTFEDGIALQSKLTVAELTRDKHVADEKEARAKEAADKQKEINKKALEDAKKLRALEFEDFKAGIEIKLLAAEKGSAEELDLQKQLLRAKLQIDLEGEGLSLNQRRLLIKQFFKDRIELEKAFNKAAINLGLEDQKNRDAAILENLNLNEKEKLDVKIEFLQLAAAQEVLLADGNAAKIKAINAKLNADITAAKIESIKKAADQEARILAVINGPKSRALDAVANNEKLKTSVRIAAIRQQGEIAQAALDKEIAANRAANEVIGADHRALNIEEGELYDKKAAKADETEAKITALTKAENEKRKQDEISAVQATIQGLQGIADIIGNIDANEQERTKNAIDNRRQEIKDLLDSGAITEKEARLRNRRLDDEEKKSKQKAARQIKNLAVFQAILAIPQAYLAGLQTPIIGAIVGPLYAAIAAVEAGIIASRPLPSFATGKKGSYKGLANVGEAGAELIQRADGSMEVATRKSLVYLGAQDKVFTAGETKRMMPFVNKESMAGVPRETFDYDKLAKAVKQKQANGSIINIDKEFISESVANGLSRVNYFDRYYNSKG